MVRRISKHRKAVMAPTLDTDRPVHPAARAGRGGGAKTAALRPPESVRRAGITHATSNAQGRELNVDVNVLMLFFGDALYERFTRPTAETAANN